MEPAVAPQCEASVNIEVTSTEDVLPSRAETLNVVCLCPDRLESTCVRVAVFTPSRRSVCCTSAQQEEEEVEGEEAGVESMRGRGREQQAVQMKEEVKVKYRSRV